ncbi:MAG: hypothetical protein WCB67_05820 [Solirubrobacteraceae bacterium]
MLAMFPASGAAIGAQAPRSQAASKQKAAQGPRPGRYTGKTTAGDPTPTGVNQLAIEAQRSVSRHRLELTVVTFHLWATCAGTSDAELSVYAVLPKPPSIPATFNRAISMTFRTYSYGAKSPTGTAEVHLSFRSNHSVTGTFSFTKKFPTDGRVCTTGTRPFELHFYGSAPPLP